MNLIVGAPQWIVVLLFLALIAAAIEDALRLRISNITCAAVVILAVVAMAYHGFTLSLWQNVVVFIAILVLGTPAFAAGWFGGGDVKLFAGLGAFAGVTLGLEIELSSFTLLAVFALVQLAFRGQLLLVLGNVVRILLRPFRTTDQRLPLSPASLTQMRMGPAIAVAVFVMAVTEWLPWLA